jgi:hypothetical protein
MSWRLWAKALGEKTGASNTEADKIAVIRTLLVVINVLTNFAIVAGILRHW